MFFFTIFLVNKTNFFLQTLSICKGLKKKQFFNDIDNKTNKIKCKFLI